MFMQVNISVELNLKSPENSDFMYRAVHPMGYLNKFWHLISCFGANSKQKATFLLLLILKSTY